jgi:hypothetical protein
MNSVGKPCHMSDRHGYAVTSAGKLETNTRILSICLLSFRFLLFLVLISAGGGGVMLVAMKNVVEYKQYEASFV